MLLEFEVEFPSLDRAFESFLSPLELEEFLVGDFVLVGAAGGLDFDLKLPDNRCFIDFDPVVPSALPLLLEDFFPSCFLNGRENRFDLEASFPILVQATPLKVYSLYTRSDVSRLSIEKVNKDDIFQNDDNKYDIRWGY
mmetsp:Transcript_11298/g.14720  ORF Transcript_11298/g.14720 Transcript_11298/m.14720 type:complete len:139 (-) Transcript_11298:484-900(-)